MKPCQNRKKSHPQKKVKQRWKKKSPQLKNRIFITRAAILLSKFRLMFLKSSQGKEKEESLYSVRSG